MEIIAVSRIGVNSKLKILEKNLKSFSDFSKEWEEEYTRAEKELEALPIANCDKAEELKTYIVEAGKEVTKGKVGWFKTKRELDNIKDIIEQYNKLVMKLNNFAASKS